MTWLESVILLLFVKWQFSNSVTAAAAKSLQSCLTLCDCIDGSPPGPPSPWDSPGKNTGLGCHFLLQCMKMKSESEVAQSCLTLSNPWTAAYQAPPSRGFSRQEYWSGMPLPSPVFFCYRSFPPFSLPILRNVIIDSCIFLKNKIDNLYFVHKDPWPVFLFLLVTLSQNPSVGEVFPADSWVPLTWSYWALHFLAHQVILADQDS